MKEPLAFVIRSAQRGRLSASPQGDHLFLISADAHQCGSHPAALFETLGDFKPIAR